MSLAADFSEGAAVSWAAAPACSEKRYKTEKTTHHRKNAAHRQGAAFSI